MLKSLIESMIDAVQLLWDREIQTSAKAETGGWRLFTAFLKEQQEIAARAKYFACC